MATAGGLVKTKRKRSLFKESELSNAYFDKGSGKYIQLQGTSQVAVEYDPKKHSSLPDGFGVINVDLDPEDSAPVSVTVRDWKILVPRNSNRVVPLSHIRVLDDAVTTKYNQPVFGQQLVAIPSKRFNFRVIKWPKAGGKIIQTDLDDAVERHESILVDED